MISRHYFPSVITAINATVKAARRVNADSAYWEIDVQPHSLNQIRLILEAHPDCNSSDSALCTYNRKPLFNHLDVIIETQKQQVNIDSSFDIELIFSDDNVSQVLKNKIRAAADQWEDIIVQDLPDFISTNTCSYSQPSSNLIDDVRIYVSFTDSRYSHSSLCETRASDLPASGHIVITRDESIEFIMDNALHEIGHVLGIGLGNRWNVFVKKINGEYYFTGPLAVAAFNKANNELNHAKIPLDSNGQHWLHEVIYDDISRELFGTYFLNAITIQALADIGYVVDVTQADSYTLRSFSHLIVTSRSNEISVAEKDTTVKRQNGNKIYEKTTQARNGAASSVKTSLNIKFQSRNKKPTTKANSDIKTNDTNRMKTSFMLPKESSRNTTLSIPLLITRSKDQSSQDSMTVRITGAPVDPPPPIRQNSTLISNNKILQFLLEMRLEF